MKILKSILSVVAAATIVACGHDVDDYQTNNRMVEVGFSMPVAVDQRTTIGEDGKTTHWEAGDKVALWARNSSGDYTLSGSTFYLHHFSTDYNRAIFTATIPEMAEDTYDYMFCSPLPKSTNGTKVTYTVSSTQDGTYQGEHDIMIATPVTAPALDDAATSEFEVSMHHMMHALRITIPEGRNLFGYRFTRLEITFPIPVVGDITLDVKNPDADPVYSNLSNTLVIENANGFDAGDTIWAFVLPGTVDGTVSYSVKGENRRSVVNDYPMSRNLQSGHVTPISMATPELYLYTVFYIRIDENFLGEDFNSFTVTDHNGNQLGSFMRNAENIYPLEFFGEIDLSQHQNKDLTITFDSDHAIVTNTVNTGTITPYCEHYLEPVDVPYLFEEDFSSVPSFGDGHDDPANGFNGDSKNYSSWFADHTSNARMAGWSGGRYGCSGGQSIRMCCRSETGLGSIKNYRGRVDSAPMSKIKSGVTTGLRVQFDYSAATRSYLLSSGSTLLKFGWTNSTGVIGPATNISNIVINGLEITDSSGSYTNVATHADVKFTGASNATRLSWMSDTNAPGALAGNANFWLYVDNIKVQIAN